MQGERRASSGGPDPDRAEPSLTCDFGCSLLLLLLLSMMQTPLHVYEARCTACSSTGWARAPSNGRRGQLGTCMVCHGLGECPLLLLDRASCCQRVGVCAAVLVSKVLHAHITWMRACWPSTRAGYVRRTTSRFCPDDPDKHMTIARPLTWDGKFAARINSNAGNGSSSSSQGGSSNSSQGDSSPDS